MKRNSVPLHIVIESIDQFFLIEEWKSDPAMSRFVPKVYQKINREITRLFEPSFCKRFNGIMIRSSERVGKVYCAASPSSDI